MIEDMKRRNYAPRTIKIYVARVATFAQHFGKSPQHLGAADVRAYLLFLVQEKHASWSYYGQAMAALKFLYRTTLGKKWVVDDVVCPKQQKRLPVVLSPDEVTQFFEAIPSLKHRALLMTAYAAGLRVSEVIALRIDDIDSRRMVIRLRQAKGRKDRYTLLSPRLLAIVRAYWKADRPTQYRDAFLDCYGGTLSPEQRRVLSNVAACRTAALGGHVEECDQCGLQQIAYNSCRNRHCPKCQATAAARWMEDRKAELLPVEYFHVAFTLPAVLAPIALQNPRTVYGILFQAAAETLQQIALDPQHLGAEIGFLAVLHTWGQNLEHHPHVHCVVPGGGLSPDGAHWVACRSGFFLPVHVLSAVFRGKFLALLGHAFDRGKDHFPERDKQHSPGSPTGAPWVTSFHSAARVRPRRLVR
jgi:integrase